jgi:hypothetical protein
MSRERFSMLLRWAGLVVGAVVLAIVLSARGSAGLQPRGAPEPIYVSAASGLSAPSPYIPRVLHDLALGSASGPYTNTAQAYSFDGDVRALVNIPAIVKPDLPELDSGEGAPAHPATLDDPVVQPSAGGSGAGPNIPSPLSSFDGLDRSHAAAVFPADTNGDVGPYDYIQTVNDNVGIYSKTTGVQLATFSFDSLFTSLTGTPCAASNRGDPVALYDAQADRFIISDFAFVSASASPYYECIAASKTGDPVAGGWWLFALRADDNAHQFLADYPKMGVWPDGIYMSANMFDCSGACTPAGFKGVRVWALSRDDLYSGSTLHAVLFDTSSAYFTLLPSNLRGLLPPAGTPNYFVSKDQGLALDVFKFHVDFTHPLSSTFSATPTQVAIAAFNDPPATVPEQAGNGLDTLRGRLMAQNQYRKIGSAESLWVAQTVDNPTGVRWYQLDVSGGTVATTPVQQSTYKPDSSNRWLPSLAVDKFGDMLVGYSVSSATMHPDIRYAGRLISDTLNSLSPEATLIVGSGSQTGNCGGNTCIRWGDYSGMTVDPVDECTFWYTTEYYGTTGANWQTRIGSIRYPACGSTNSVHFTYLPLLANGSSAPTGWTNIMQEGFEGVWPSAGWLVTDFATNNFIWGQRNCRAASGINGLWAMGGGSGGAGLACGANYIDNANAWAVYGDFSLAGATAAQFNLKLWLNTQSSLDTACLLASDDDNNYFGDCYSGTSGNAFVPESLDLSNVNGLGDLRGQSGLSVAVLFQTNASTNLANGAFVDVLLLRKCTVASCPASAEAPTVNNQVQRQSVHLVRPSN